MSGHRAIGDTSRFTAEAGAKVKPIRPDPAAPCRGHIVKPRGRIASRGDALRHSPRGGSSAGVPAPGCGQAERPQGPGVYSSSPAPGG